jgi:hypothetical protein
VLSVNSESARELIDHVMVRRKPAPLLTFQNSKREERHGNFT